MELGEGWRCLQLKLISCRDLKAFNFFNKLSVYAVVSVFDQQKKNSNSLCQQKTLVDGQGGGNPEWNHSMQFDLHPSESLVADDVFLKFKLRCGGLVYGKRSIGEVQVPLSTLIEEFNGSVRFLSYQVRDTHGNPNGVLNFSYEFIGNNKPNTIKGSQSASSNHKCSLYPSLDDILSPLPLLTAPAFYCPSPSPIIQQPRTFLYATQTLAYGFGESYPAVSWAN